MITLLLENGRSHRKLLAISPESLAKAILSSDVIRQISRVIRGEHEYRASAETLMDKVYDLLDHGLDDSECGWNETKQAELLKYIKSQKRANRKPKAKVSVPTDGATEAQVAVPAGTEVVTITLAASQKKDAA